MHVYANKLNKVHVSACSLPNSSSAWAHTTAAPLPGQGGAPMANETKSETEEHDMNRDEDTPASEGNGTALSLVAPKPNNIKLGIAHPILGHSPNQTNSKWMTPEKIGSMSKNYSIVVIDSVY